MDLDLSLAWRSATGVAGTGPLDSLHCDGYQVARLHQRLGGDWFAVLDYPDGRRLTRDCTSFDAGKSGCERWATRHLMALQAKSRRKHLELVASQPWRGDEYAKARGDLARLGS